MLDDAETQVLLRLLTLATEARTVVAGRLATGGSGGNDVLTMRLVPRPGGQRGQRPRAASCTCPACASSSRRPAPAAREAMRRRWRPRAAAACRLSDLGSYQQAVRLVLTHDVITATRPRPGVLRAVLRWADQLTRDFRDLLGYTLIATTRQVRLIRRLDALDPTQGPIFATNGKPFDRRRLAYLCLVLASFQRSRVEISLADLVRAFTPAANAIDGLGFDPTVTAHKAAVVDVLDWLVDRGALRLSDGSLEAWAHDSEHGDALYDIDHDICASLFRPARPAAAPDQRGRAA